MNWKKTLWLLTAILYLLMGIIISLAGRFISAAPTADIHYYTLTRIGLFTAILGFGYFFRRKIIPLLSLPVSGYIGYLTLKILFDPCLKFSFKSKFFVIAILALLVFLPLILILEPWKAKKKR